MTHVIAVLGLAALCIVWYLVQRWARPEGDETCHAHEPGCESCAIHGADCPSLNAPGQPSDSSQTRRVFR